MKFQNLCLLAIAVFIAFAPLVLPRFWDASNSAFDGADSRATHLISQDHSQYTPWFSPIWAPPSEEVATYLFALQAALGAGVLGYCLGRIHGKSPVEQS